METPLHHQFAERLFAKYPAWRSYVISNQDKEVDLSITVPSPNPKLSMGFFITVDDEITVGTNWFHSHFFWGGATVEIDQAMNFIDGFLNEQSVILAFFKGDKWTGSSCVGLEVAWRVPEPGERRQVLSWTGKLDSELAG
jgi:hypothetical protein